MTAALEGGEWSAARPGRTLPPEKTRYPFYRRLGGPQGRSGRAENFFPTGIRSRTAQSLVSRYTDWATQHTLCVVVKVKYTVKRNSVACVWAESRPPSTLKKKLIARKTACYEPKSQVFCDVQLRRWVKQWPKFLRYLLPKYAGSKTSQKLTPITDALCLSQRTVLRLEFPDRKTSGSNVPYATRNVGMKTRVFMQF